MRKSFPKLTALSGSPNLSQGSAAPKKTNKKMIQKDDRIHSLLLSIKNSLDQLFIPNTTFQQLSNYLAKLIRLDLTTNNNLYQFWETWERFTDNFNEIVMEDPLTRCRTFISAEIKEMVPYLDISDSALAKIYKHIDSPLLKDDLLSIRPTTSNQIIIWHIDNILAAYQDYEEGSSSIQASLDLVHSANERFKELIPYVSNSGSYLASQSRTPPKSKIPILHRTPSPQQSPPSHVKPSEEELLNAEIVELQETIAKLGANNLERMELIENFHDYSLLGDVIHIIDDYNAMLSKSNQDSSMIIRDLKANPNGNQTAVYSTSKLQIEIRSLDQSLLKTKEDLHFLKKQRQNVLKKNDNLSAWQLDSEVWAMAPEIERIQSMISECRAVLQESPTVTPEVCQLVSEKVDELKSEQDKLMAKYKTIKPECQTVSLPRRESFDEVWALLQEKRQIQIKYHTQQGDKEQLELDYQYIIEKLKTVNVDPVYEEYQQTVLALNAARKDYEKTCEIASKKQAELLESMVRKKEVDIQTMMNGTPVEEEREQLFHEFIQLASHLSEVDDWIESNFVIDSRGGNTLTKLKLAMESIDVLT